MKILILSVCFLSVITSCKEEEVKDPYTDPAAAYFDPAMKPFYHGVASGDPLQDGVILWTRITPDVIHTKTYVRWEISKTDQFTTLEGDGIVSTSEDYDFTVKVDVSPERAAARTLIFTGSPSILP